MRGYSLVFPFNIMFDKPKIANKDSYCNNYCRGIENTDRKTTSEFVSNIKDVG